MTKEDIIVWLENEFAPLILATPDLTLGQIVDNAIRYWNTHSGYKISTMIDITGIRMQLPATFKTVVEAYPNTQYAPVLVDFSNTLLLGMTVLDNVATDMILMSEAFKNYKSYISGQFNFRFEMSQDPTVGGYLYVYNVPQGVTQLFCVGTKRILADEDITSEYILNFLLYYSKALLKLAEGNLLRKSDIIGIKNDGDRLYNEGEKEVEKLEDQLSKDSRWLSFAKRA